VFLIFSVVRLKHPPAINYFTANDYVQTNYRFAETTIAARR